MARISRAGCRLIVNVLLLLLPPMCLVQTATAQLGQNSPPVMFLDRDWYLAEDELVGTKVTRVQAHDDDGDLLLHGLEPHMVIIGPPTAIDRLPFRISNYTGIVHLNESLAGRGGEEFSIYVTVFDGVVEVKNEVHVHVLKKGADGGAGPPRPFGPASFNPHVRNVTDRFPAFGMLPGVAGANGGGGNVYGGGGGGGVGIGGSLPHGMFGASQPPHRQTHTYPSASAKPTEISGNKNPPEQPYFGGGDGDDKLNGDGGGGGVGVGGAAVDDDESVHPSIAGKNTTDDYPQTYTYSNNRGNKTATTTRLTTARPPAAEATAPTNDGDDDGDATGTDAAADAGTGTDHASSTDNSNNGGGGVTASNEAGRLSLTHVLSICGVVMLAASVAAGCMCRQYLCAVGRRIKTKSKEEMAKKSNASGSISSGPMGGGGSIGGASSLAGTEDSRNSMVMQNWSGPRAFSNRYVPWERDGNLHAQVSSQLSTSSSTGTAISKSDRWEFPRHRLKFFNVLGQGAFGLVWRCEATDMDGNEGISVVAVKTLKENASDIEIKDLNSELQVMKSLEPHVNVVRLLGCCTDKDPIFVILEFVNRGKLQDYLRNSRAEKHYGSSHGKSNTLTSGDLTSFMYQVARGMEYLSSRGIIHRDLAARNILITDDHTCKVADFGFARDVVTSKVYERKSEGKLPIRWMAIESLYDDIFSVKSDIWSFGILMWEIVTLGSTPYPGISASDVMRKVRDGYRLEKPEHCRRELYNIMYYCWSRDFNARPPFSELVELLDRLLVTEMDYIELERFPDHNYYNMSSLSGEKL